MFDFARLAKDLFALYQLILLGRIILSWVPGIDRRHPAARFLIQITDPYLEPFRRVIPPVGGLDISPIIAFFVLRIAQELVIAALGGL
ncbi:MAG: YggT family protein [Armatimonadetes bacterium]|nr:YggT family protein [Armatimonadota bacterium]